MLDLSDHGLAPFAATLASGPPEVSARWIMADDGVRLRAVHWNRAASRGTVLLFNGRTEYAEKYGRVATAFAKLDCALVTVDWRGQGLSDRLRADRVLGHVDRFGDYQIDVAAMVAHARDLDLPEPWFLLAHSMGGAIGLRALADGLPVRAAAFSAPMWGIRMAGALKPVAWSVSEVGRQLGLGHLLTPGQEPACHVTRCDFADNPLTSDRETFEWMRAQVTAEPDLALGGPSLHWLNEALREMWRLMHLRAPEIPALVFVGTNEVIVDPARIRRRVASWPGAKLVTIPTARHELLMETPAIRSRVLREIAAHFAQRA